MEGFPKNESVEAVEKLKYSIQEANSRVQEVVEILLEALAGNEEHKKDPEFKRIWDQGMELENYISKSPSPRF